VSSRSIVGFDGSEPSKAALAWALGRGDPVLIAHVADAEAGLIGPDYAREIEARGADLVARALDDVTRRFPDADVDAVVLEGPVAWALAQVAQPGDTLVIGTHKTGFLHGRVLGSRSVEVAMLAPCDVMVVPTIDLRFRSGVVAGIAAGAGLRAVVEAAARAAADRGEELLLLHSADDRTASGERAVVAEALALARDCAPDIVIRTRTSNRHTAELLLDASRGRALLVLGSGTGDRARSPIGSVLHDVLLNMTAPVLVTHAGAPTGPDAVSAPGGTAAR